MSKKFHLLFSLFLAISFFSFNWVYADVVINEVQVLPTGNKFFELRNTGSSSVDLTGWYIKKKTASGTESSLVVAARFDGKSISANGYFLIANETGYTGSGTLGTGWPPSNTGVASNNTLILYDSNNSEVDKVGWGSAIDCDSPCPDNPSEGQSIQRTDSGSWITDTPTPGEENETSSGDNDSGDDENADEEDEEDGAEENNTNTGANSSSSSGSSSSSSGKKSATEPKPKVIKNPTMKAKISANTLAFAGQPLPMDADILGFSDEKVVLGRAYWNFGDGETLEQINSFEKFSHTYYYPGEYAVFLEYYQSKFSLTPEATSKMTIKVIPLTVAISKVGDAADFFVELSNNASSDVDVSNWIINANGKTFILPRNSVIMGKRQMTLSGKVTGFVHGDQSNLKLFSSTGEMIFDYLGVPVPSAPVPEIAAVWDTDSAAGAETTSALGRSDTDVAIPTRESIGQQGNVGTGAAEIPASNLEALAIDSIEKDGDNSYLPSIVSVIFIGASAGAVYFIRQKKTAFKLGEDFKILDE